MKGKGMKGGCYKKGGAVSGKSINFDSLRTNGGGSKPRKAHGASPKARLDKKARGGKIATASSPMSGAAPKGISGQNTGENN